MNWSVAESDENHLTTAFSVRQSRNGYTEYTYFNFEMETL